MIRKITIALTSDHFFCQMSLDLSQLQHPTDKCFTSFGFSPPEMAFLVLCSPPNFQQTPEQMPQVTARATSVTSRIVLTAERRRSICCCVTLALYFARPLQNATLVSGVSFAMHSRGKMTPVASCRLRHSRPLPPTVHPPRLPRQPQKQGGCTSSTTSFHLELRQDGGTCDDFQMCIFSVARCWKVKCAEEVQRGLSNLL